MKKSISILMIVTLILSLLFTAVSCTKDSGTPETTAAIVTTEAHVTTEAPTETEALPDLETPTPLLWRVTDGDGHELYLFGTIHVGDERNDAVLERVSPVLDACDALAVEFDLVAYAENTSQMMRDMTQYVLTDGSKVSDYMPEDVYTRAVALLNQAGLFPSAFTYYNLAWWAQMMDTAMLTVYCDLNVEKGMDSLLIHRANDRAIPVLEVESSEFQMTLLNSFDNELYLLMIEDALDSTETYNDEVTELYEFWLSGDKDAFWTYLASESDESGYTEEQLALLADYNRQLLDVRNLGMRDKAIEYLNSGETVFFAVGAAHMANEAGLVQLLLDAGYTVEAVEY